MFVDMLSEPLAAAVACSVDRALERAGYSLVIATGTVGDVDASRRVRSLIGRGVDALLSWEGTLPSLRKTSPGAQAIPWLAFSDSDATAGTFRAGVGRRKGAVLACRYLLSLGHLRVGAIGSTDGAATSALRETLGAGAARLLTAEPGDGRPEMDAVLAMQTLLDATDAPTAILCSSDLQAATLLRECHRQGVAVPRELSIVGFGDSGLARQTWPALTTVRLPVEEIGAWAAEAIVVMLRGGAPGAFDPLPKLVVRESTAEAPR
jgi:DNA-binding LacI/PurR family transcriptional regulator